MPDYMGLWLVAVFLGYFSGFVSALAVVTAVARDVLRQWFGS